MLQPLLEPQEGVLLPAVGDFQDAWGTLEALRLEQVLELPRPLVPLEPGRDQLVHRAHELVSWFAGRA